VRVGVVGAGFAGLRAAMLLESSGAEVRVFEARNRVGGRCQTVDEGGGVQYEAGGEWIDADHLRVLRLLQSFGMEPAHRDALPRKLIHRGRETTALDIWSDALEDELRVEAAAKELCKNLHLPIWKNPTAKSLDDRTLADFIREHALTERGRWWVTSMFRSDEGDDLERIGLLGWLAGILKTAERDGDELSAFRFEGGSSRVLAAMQSSLSTDVQFGRILRRVSQEGKGVTLIFEDGIERFDQVVLTLPPPALEQVVFEPALSARKRCAIEGYRMSRAIKISWEFDHAWWEDDGWGGSLQCDGPLQQTWSAGLGGAPVLSAYICGKEARDWMQLGDPVRAGVYELSVLFPAAARHFRRGWTHNWPDDPFAMGAFSHLAPGFVLEHLAHVAPPERRIHFAGEHTATWNGFIEGALESAERAHAEVMSA